MTHPKNPPPPSAESEIVMIDKVYSLEALLRNNIEIEPETLYKAIVGFGVKAYRLLAELSVESNEHPLTDVQQVLYDEDGHESWNFTHRCESISKEQLWTAMLDKDCDNVVFRRVDIYVLTKELRLDLQSVQQTSREAYDSRRRLEARLTTIIEKAKQLQDKLAVYAPKEHMVSPEFLNEPQADLTIALGQRQSPAAIAKAEKADKDWEKDVEIAVKLAVKCAEDGKKLSTAKHEPEWIKLRGEPRVKAFRAFRRGLPSHLKEKGPSGD